MATRARSESKASFCSNCISKMEMLDIRPQGVYCKCSNCQSQKFFLCGACKVVPYCSRECQMEHWLYNHENLCKNFSSTPISPEDAFYFDFGAIMMGENYYKLKIKKDRLEQCFFWALFKSDRGMLVDHIEMGAIITGESKAHLPVFPIEGQPNGWIDEYLNYLTFLILKLIVDDEAKSLSLLNIMRRLALFRAVYNFHLSLEKDRKLTELKFAVLALRDLSFDLTDHCCPCFDPSCAQDPIECHDKIIRSSGACTEIWETFLFHLSKLCKRLRMVKYKFINMESLKKKMKKRAGEYTALEPFYNNGLRLLNNVSVKLDKDGDWQLRNNRAILPAQTFCVGCKTDLGGRKAQLLLTQPLCDIWAEDFSVVRVADTPCVLEMSNNPRPIVTCGRWAECNAHAKVLYLTFLGEELKALLPIMLDGRICSGCSKYSLKTHKCPRCRRVRYCSQTCLNQDWKYHKVRCEEELQQTGAVRQELLAKKLEGEEKTKHNQDRFQRLVFYDPFIGAMTIHCGQFAKKD